ncbi:MAG: hypothetical protein ABIZ80_04030, partial [Bryobacteraceae bacterium]
MAAARENVIAVSRQIAIDLHTIDASQRDTMLERYSETYGVHFLIYGADGRQIAGTATVLPQEVTERLRRFTPAVPRTPTPDQPARGSGSPTGPPPFLIVAGTPERYWVGVRTQVPDPPGSESTMRATLLLVSPGLWNNPFFIDSGPWLGIVGLALAASLLCWLPLVRGMTHA